MKTFGSNLKRKWYFSEMFCTQLCFDIYIYILCCKIIRSQIDFKLKVRTEFLMYGENTNTIAIPIYRVQGRSQDFSEGVSQEPRQQRRRRVVCHACAHTSSTLILASFPGLLPPLKLLCTMRKRNLTIARRVRSGDFGTKLRKSSALCSYHARLILSTTLLQARSVVSRTRHTANRSCAPSSSTL